MESVTVEFKGIFVLRRPLRVWRSDPGYFKLAAGTAVRVSNLPDYRGVMFVQRTSSMRAYRVELTDWKFAMGDES